MEEAVVDYVAAMRDVLKATFVGAPKAYRSGFKASRAFVTGIARERGPARGPVRGAEKVSAK